LEFIVKWEFRKWKESVKSPTLTEEDLKKLLDDSDSVDSSRDKKSYTKLAETTDPRGNWSSWNQEKKCFEGRPY
jgi:hypothetical protein